MHRLLDLRLRVQIHCSLNEVKVRYEDQTPC